MYPSSICHLSPRSLIKYACDNTSQNGEDGIIARIFNDLLPTAEQRYCVDVGAWDGNHLSNSYSLLVPSGDGSDGHTTTKWNGVLIEADQTRFEDLKKLHEPLWNTCICAEVSCQSESSQSLLSVLKGDAEHLPQNFDLLSIDVDGTDYWILADILGEDERYGYRPKVICIEFNPTMPIGESFRMGCAALAYRICIHIISVLCLQTSIHSPTLFFSF